jgi:endonuclease/exonuclease/phosphatase family metal-dependent hydrolase
MRIAAILIGLVLVPEAAAQWGPTVGDWGKSEPSDVRVMTWNVSDSLCRTANKDDDAHNWAAVARTVAALRPDVLLLQECADNSGNGTGTGIDSAATSVNVIDLFLHGGTDIYLGGQVGAYVQKYAPTYDLPYVYASTQSDGYNRNIMLSRFPFSDLNGDSRSRISDIPDISASSWATGGDGGLRGFQFIELDLPDAVYSGDLVVGNAHLKSGSGTANHTQRVDAASNVAYYVDHLYNGAGLGIPDPLNEISDSPAATTILPQNTAVVLGGDWNEDELGSSQKGPAEWLTAGVNVGGTDGTDRDRSDMTFDSAIHVFTGSDGTFSSSKYDYLAWQDSIVSLRRAVIFSTSGTPASALPSEFDSYPNPTSLSNTASDHRVVFTDLILPVVDTCNDIYEYCIGTPNSTGFPGTINYSGSPSISGANFNLLAQSTVPSQFGIFYYGPNQTQVSFGHGYRCISAGLIGTFRLFPVLQADAFGDVQCSLDWSSVPVGSGAGQIGPGETWNFQYWYRDPAAGSPGFNLTPALAVRFCP